MKKQAAKTAMVELLPPPTRGTKVWISEAKHPQGSIVVLAAVDGTMVACRFAKGRTLTSIGKEWQRLYKQLDFQTGKAPKTVKLSKAAPIGTPFQRAVWLAVSFIPHGCVAAYLDIAVAIGRPKAMRAVGNAVGKNPLAPFVPCHRVIAANGTIGGYTGGLATKRALLKAEGTLI